MSANLSQMIYQICVTSSCMVCPGPQLVTHRKTRVPGFLATAPLSRNCNFVQRDWSISRIMRPSSPRICAGAAIIRICRSGVAFLPCCCCAFAACAASKSVAKAFMSLTIFLVKVFTSSSSTPGDASDLPCHPVAYKTIEIFPKTSKV